MPVRPSNFLEDLPFDTPPLSPSRSPSSMSANRSSGASSNSSLNLGDLGARMLKTRIDHQIAQEPTESVDPQGASRKFAHDSAMFNATRERDIQEELEADIDQDGYTQNRGRSGYEECPFHHQSDTPHRPVMPRQGSYSKRHSSFDTPREVPFPSGFLASSTSPLSNQPLSSRELQHERSNSISTGLQGAEQQSGESMDIQDDDSSNGSSNDDTRNSASPPRRPNFERSSSSSLPLPTSMPYSSLPPLEPQEPHRRFENPRPPPLVQSHSMSFMHSKNNAFVVSPPRTASLNQPLPKPEASSRFPFPSRMPRQSPSPPILADEPDEPDQGQSGNSKTSLFSPTYDSRAHTSLPPPAKVSSLPTSLSSRPTSFPQGSSSNTFTSHTAGSSLPPPQPPTILTPPLPLSAAEESARKPAPYEPFLPRDQPPADHTYIAVETVPSEYRLLVRLPGFQRDSITLAMRRRRILHVVADNWSDGGGHFERRISFGYDADLASIRAEFDGEILKIIVPRRTLPGWFGQSSS